MANAKLDKLDYYALLKVPRDAPADDVQRAFHRFAAKYHPDKHVAEGASATKQERANEVYRRGAEAYRVLCDPERRRIYDAGLAEGRKRYDANAPPPAAAPREATRWKV